MNTVHSKYFATARKMDEALIALLQKKDLEYITVKEICQMAEVNRSTFYLHYENISDLLEETAEYVNAGFLKSFSDIELHITAPELIESLNPENLVFVSEEYLLPYLAFIRENMNLYRAFFRNPGRIKLNIDYGFIKNNVILPVLNRFGIDSDKGVFYADYYIHGIGAMVKRWLETDCTITDKELAQIIIDCVRPPKIQRNKNEKTDR